MFTLSSARGAIANPAFFARGSADAREGRVSGVTVEEKDGLLIYRGNVQGADCLHQVKFEYDEELETFIHCECSCADAVKAVWGCRHVAALMVAACGGAGEIISAREGGAFIEEILAESRSGVLTLHKSQDAPVRLYPVLQRVSGECVRFGLRIGRTRPYVVRSMAEFALRAKKRELTIYGRELTFSHKESELAGEEAVLYGYIVMLAGDERIAKGAELELSGAALDQMMRLLDGREVELRGANGETMCARVKQSSLQLPLEVGSEHGNVQLHVMAEHLALGDTGAYCFGAEEILCAYGQDFERIASLVRIAVHYPSGIRFEEAQLDRVCMQVLAPAMSDLVVRKGQQLITSRLPAPMMPKFYVDKAGTNRLTCRVCFDYCGTQLDADEQHPHIRRNTVLEEEILSLVHSVFTEQVRAGEYACEGGDDACFSILSDKLPAMETTGEVMVTPRVAQMNVKKRRTMTFGLSQEKDKLVLRAQTDEFTQEDLDAALYAYRQKKKYVRLKSGAFLSGEALEQAADAAQVLDSLDVSADQVREGVQVEPSRALYLDEALKGRESIRLSAPKAIEDWTQRLKNAQQIKAESPKGLKAQLRSYQLAGLNWLCALEAADFGGVLADDMGLGKTIQALSMLQCSKERGEDVRALVVCPASLQLNWQAEAKKFVPDLTCMALTGSGKERAQIIKREEPLQLMITSYDQLRRDIQLYQDIRFTHVLLDEAQNIKNAASQAAKAVKVLKADHRFAMTGTPIENRLSELWSIFDFIMPGYLLTYKKFRDRFEAPIVRDGNEKARQNLHLMVAPFILRRMKRDVLSDLPEKVETVMTSDMTAEQKKLYMAHAREVAKSAEAGVLPQDQIRVLSALTRLRQLCCDPRLCLENYQGGSGKLMQMLEIIRDALEADHHILLFSQFTSMLDLIAQALDAEGISYYILTGETEKEERMRLVEQFNAGGADVFLISLKAGGTGLNLTGADVIIHYDPWWNMAAQNQATDRAYRIGQTKGVQVIRLIAADTVEERILHLQESKRELSDGILLGEENLFTMDADTLQSILK